MADPSPPVDLPEEKYIEIFNTSEYPLVLPDWTLTHGNTDRSLPFIYLPPRDYAIMTTEEGAASFQGTPNVYGVPGLSSTFLTLGGQRLTLSDPEGNIISWVEYSNTWYDDASKEEGGWSLEKIDPWNYCGEAENWKASKSITGGTPGSENSVYDQNPDSKPPILLGAGYESPEKVILNFNEPMDKGVLSNPENYHVDQGIGTPVMATLFPGDFKKVMLTLPESATEGLIYNVSVNEQISDCAGNTMVSSSVPWGIPKEPDSAGMVINEILFNPQQEGERYVELYNRSGLITDLKNYILTSEDELTGEMTSIREISDESQLFFPGEYRLLTADTIAVLQQYMTQNRRGFIQTDLPSMTNNGGVLILSSIGRKIQERIEYDEQMHYALLTDHKGVALERLNFDRPGNEQSNWLSAAQNVGFGTPAFQNSQFTSHSHSHNASIQLHPEIFSPDNDGHNDVLNISYKMEKPGYTAHVSIYDPRGRLVKILERNVLLATEGVWVWDGTTEENLKANIGIYIVFMEIFDENGNVENHKETTVLGGRMP
jgi:pyruvoyl-dependent arginine decarboxylase (PvlArgDC)